MVLINFMANFKKYFCFPGKETRWRPDDLPQQTAIGDEWQQQTTRGRAGGG